MNNLSRAIAKSSLGAETIQPATEPMIAKYTSNVKTSFA